MGMRMYKGSLFSLGLLLLTRHCWFSFAVTHSRVFVFARVCVLCVYVCAHNCVCNCLHDCVCIHGLSVSTVSQCVCGKHTHTHTLQWASSSLLLSLLSRSLSPIDPELTFFPSTLHVWFKINGPIHWVLL